MFKLTSLPRLAPALRPLPRALHTTRVHLDSGYNRTKNPDLSQSHSTDKKDDPLHADGDVTTASERAADSAKKGAESNASGEDQPIDAARQGSAGGESKVTSAQKDQIAKDGGMAGSFKDQVGGQDMRDKGKGVEWGGRTETAGGSTGDSIKKGFEKVIGKDGGRYFSTSARTRFPTSASSFPGSTTDPSARQPKDSKVEQSNTDQNAHLKHSDASKPDAGTKTSGNAASTPHLPSHQIGGKGSKGFHTTAYPAASKPVSPSDSKAKGPDDTQVNASDPDKNPELQTSEPSSTSAAPDIGRGTTSGNNPKMPTRGRGDADKKADATKGAAGVAGKGVRGMHTSASAFADRTVSPSDSSAKGPEDTQVNAADADKNPELRTSEPSSSGTTPDMGAGTTGEDSPTLKSRGRGDADKKADASKGAEGVSGKGLRGMHTSTRTQATKPPGGYSKAKEPEANSAGYDAPSEALPPNLNSTYDASANEPIDGNTHASGNVPHSSSAVDPPNPTLAQQAKEGTLGDRNPPPNSEAGELGLNEAWKHRK